MPYNVDLSIRIAGRVSGPQIARGAWARPRFYFHVWREGQLEVDEVGVALPTLDSARRHAECIASAILAETPASPESASGWDIEVTDHAGQTVFIIPARQIRRMRRLGEKRERVARLTERATLGAHARPAVPHT